MKPFRLAVATAIATWILLLIGATVNPMGASMACPDWYFIPTCNGELLPEMTGGVLYEHGHRLWASWVGLLTLVLAFVTWRSKHVDATSKKYAIWALVLVCVQGTLGGITVKLNLSSSVSTLHLGTAMAYFCLVIALCFRLAPQAPAGSAPDGRRILWIATGAVLVQIILGGTVRHLGAGLICGDDFIGCGPAGWTKQPLAHLHMTHRFFAYALVPVVLLAGRHAGRQAALTGNKLAAMLAKVPAMLVLTQVALGLATVATGRSVVIVTFHTAIGAALLASMWACLLALGPSVGAATRNGGRS